MAVQEQGGLAPEFRDRGDWLIVCGIVELLIGAVCVLLGLLMLLGPFFASAAPQTQAQPMSVRTMAPIALFYVAAAVFFVWMGIGTFMGRRWARALMLIVSWLWLIAGLFGMGFWLMMAPSLLKTTNPGTAPVPDAVTSAIRLFMTVLAAVLYVLLPSIFVLFYSSKNIKATFEFKDPQPRWTDCCPVPVLALSLMLGYGALACLYGLSYNTIPFFGRLLTGVPAVVVLLVLAVLCGYLAREVYRLRMSGWWGVFAFGVLGALSNILTFRQLDILDLYEKMGFTAQQLEPLKSMHLLERFNIPLWTVVWAVVGLGYLIYVRKYFAAGPGDEREV